MKAENNSLFVLRNVERILKEKRGYVFKPPVGEPVVLLASGGMDSTVAMDKIIREWNTRVYPLFIRRGARSGKYEERAFDFLFRFYQKRFPGYLGEPCKVSTRIPPAEFKSYFSSRTLRSLGYPLRDASLLNVGIQYASALNERRSLGIHTVVIAMTPDETFPHCDISVLRAAALLACVDTGDWRWQIISPFTEPALGKPWYKKNLIAWAARYGIPLEKTRTCVAGGEKADGTCQECVWRLKAFRAAGVGDPVEYERSER